MRISVLLTLIFITTFGFSQLEVLPIYTTSNSVTDARARLSFTNDTLNLPFEENFATLNLGDKWQDNQGVYLNNHFAKNQPSIGVLTLDGVDGTGEPYVFSENKSSAAGIGDYITSAYINTSDVLPADGLTFSFFWEQGTPHDPNRDPLWSSGERLEVYFKDTLGDYELVWPTPEIVNRIVATGISRDTFYLENILVEPQFFHEGFQFKLEYFGTLVGNYGIFNVDNISLKTGVASFVGTDTLYTESVDYAISTAPRTFLNEYSSVPLTHFLDAGESIIVDSLTSSVYSLDTVAFLQDTDSSIYITEESTGDVIYSSGSNDFDFSFLEKGTPLIIKWANDQATIKSNVDNYIGVDEVSFRTTVSLNTPDSEFETDSASSVTTLSNYYAYDDGTAEAGLGVRNVGEFVEAFDFIKDDVIAGFYIYYPKYGLKLENTFITYKLYSSLKGIDGASSDVLLYSPSGIVEYSSDSITLNKYVYIEFAEPIAITAGRYYLGLEQDNENRILIGLDYSNDRSEDIYYREFSDPWETFASNDGYGCLTLRPIMNSISLGLFDDKANTGITIYPNPGIGTFYFDSEVDEVTVFTTSGVEILRTETSNNSVDLSILEKGLYLIQMSNNQTTVVQKLYVGE